MGSADRMNGFFASLVVIMDEFGARCLSCVPKDIAKKGYLVQDHRNGVVTCTKVFKDANQAEIVQMGECELEGIDGDSVSCVGMKKLIGPFERITPVRCLESRSHSRGKPRYPRQTEVQHFRFARQAEELAAIN